MILNDIAAEDNRRATSNVMLDCIFHASYQEVLGDGANYSDRHGSYGDLQWAILKDCSAERSDMMSGMTQREDGNGYNTDSTNHLP